MPRTPIAFESVQVISTTELTMRCRVQSKVIVVGNLQVLSGTTVRNVGDVGRLVLPRWAVHDLGLTEPAPE